MSSTIRIVNARSREVLDSRGNPTLETDVTVEAPDGRVLTRSAMVPSGASIGSREATELRDGDTSRYLGKGVRQAIRHLQEEILPRIQGMDAANQSDLDEAMIDLDGTPLKSRLGANAILGVSLAAARAAALARETSLHQHIADLYGAAQGTTLPLPMMNILNGGAHADNSVDIQEFMILPVGAASLAEAVRVGSEVFQHLKRLLLEKHLSTGLGDEGGFAPNLDSSREALDLIADATHAAGYTLGKEVMLGLDCAASEFYADGAYQLEGRRLDADALCHWLAELARDYPIVSIEDGMAEDDWQGWGQLTRMIGDSIQLVGDDLFVTHAETLQRGVNERIANAILIKVNQIGTLTETLKTIRLAEASGYGVVISHRSGETEDAFIADLAVATNAGQIKTGSLSRSDRTAKYNRLIRIEEALGESARFHSSTGPVR